MAVRDKDGVEIPNSKKINIHSLLFDNVSKYKEIGNDYRNLLKLYYEKQLVQSPETIKALKDFIDSLIYKSITSSKDVTELYQLFILSGDGWLNTNIEGENLTMLSNQFENQFDSNVLKLVDAYIENAKLEGAVINQDLIWLSGSGKETIEPEDVKDAIKDAIKKHDELHPEQSVESFNTIVLPKKSFSKTEICYDNSGEKSIVTRPGEIDTGAVNTASKNKNKNKREKKEMKANQVKVLDGKVYLEKIVDDEKVYVDTGIFAAGKDLSQIQLELKDAGLIKLKDKKKKKKNKDVETKKKMPLWKKALITGAVAGVGYAALKGWELYNDRDIVILDASAV